MGDSEQQAVSVLCVVCDPLTQQLRASGATASCSTSPPHRRPESRRADGNRKFVTIVTEETPRKGGGGNGSRE